MIRSTVELLEAHFKKIKALTIKNKSSFKIELNNIVGLGLASLERKSEEKFKFNPPLVEGKEEPEINISNRESLFSVFDVERKI